jgi:DNA-binding response OmpR family regulator
MKVLLIDDSERLRRALAAGLKNSGFVVDAAADGDEGLAYARHGTHDVVILDLMLPKIDGLTVLRRLRESGSRVHVLILSAKDQVGERVEGLALGADDYLTKPFAFDELVARLRALVRRKYGTKDPVIALGELNVDLGRREARCAGRDLHLTPAEFALLEHLLARRGRVVSKAELLEHLYADAGQGSENAVEVFVHQLRRKIQAQGGGDPIVTRRGHGYLVE